MRQETGNVLNEKYPTPFLLILIRAAELEQTRLADLYNIMTCQTLP